MAERSEVILTDGVRLRVDTHGPQDAPLTVVLLHGWCQDRRNWHHQVAALQAMDPQPRILAYDARGHGRSSATRLTSATLDQLGEDLAEVLRQRVPAGPIVLGGHSMGGMAIMEYAHLYPDEFATRVAGLFFTSTTAEGHTHTQYGLPSYLATLMRTGEVVGAGLLARSGAWRPHSALLPALRPAVRWLLFGDEYDPAALELTMKAFGRASLRSIGGFRASIGAQQRLDTLAALGDVPATVMVGDRDRLTPPPCAESIAHALPNAELSICRGAGHMLMLERPFEVSYALVRIAERAMAGRQRRRLPDPRTGYDQAA
jgi:pimeloyl-ACP methyl ester carboxylesterase